MKAPDIALTSSRVPELMLKCTRVMNEQLDYRIVQFLGPGEASRPSL